MALKPAIFRKLILAAMPATGYTHPGAIAGELETPLTSTEAEMRALARDGALVMVTPGTVRRNPAKPADGFWPSFRLPTAEEREAALAAVALREAVAVKALRLSAALGIPFVFQLSGDGSATIKVDPDRIEEPTLRQLEALKASGYLDFEAGLAGVALSAPVTEAA